jgi:hypothetical protein
MTGAHRLAIPRRARVLTDADGQPRSVDDRQVDSIRETWLLEDRWWTEEPLRRRYWELVGERGRNVIVFQDLRSGGWFSQGA